MPEDPQTYHRARTAALIGLGVQFLLAIAMLLVGLWSRSPAVHAATWYLFGGLPVWGVLGMVFHQLAVERAEALEAEQLSRSDAQTAAIFDEHADDLQLAQKRLSALLKWGLNSVSLFVAAYLLIVGSTLLVLNVPKVTRVTVTSTIRSGHGPEATPIPVTEVQAISAKQLDAVAMRADASPMALLFLCLGIGFVGFVVARYVAGMTRQPQWQLLRGGAGFLMGNAFVALLLAIAAVVAELGHRQLLAYLAVVVPAITGLIGLEILITFLLGAYRPRRPGEIPRPAFDSRALGLLTSPESLTKAINDAINYQFGFEVSRSWFYQLLSRAITPLCLFALVVLLGISAVVIVGPHEEAIITRNGSITAVRGPGIHVKWPWPIGRAAHYPVGRVQEIAFGTAHGELDPSRAILWTNPHGQGTEDFFAVPASSDLIRRISTRDDAGARDAQSTRAPGISLVGVQVIVHYRIQDVREYALSAIEPQKMLRTLSEQAVNAYFVTKDIDTLLGEGRVVAGDELRGLIQQRVEADRLGVMVVFVGLQGLHPPQDEEVAKAFLKQVGALQEMQAAIEDARRKRTEILAQVAGSEMMAEHINEAIRNLAAPREDAGQDGDEPEGSEDAIRTLETLIAQAGGEASQHLYDAIAYRWRAWISTRARADRFVTELAAFEHAPEYFRTKRYFEVLAEGMGSARKFVIDPKSAEPSIFRIDLHDRRPTQDILLGPEEE